MIEFRNTKIYLPHHAEAILVRGLIADGESVAIRGPSGCGKSSFLNAIALLPSENSGEVQRPEYLIGGSSSANLDAWELSCGYSFQDSHLLSHLSVLENLLFPLKYREPFKHWSLELKKDRALSFLNELGLSHLAEHRVESLSGGEAQRVSLLRACIYDPKLLLLDESLSALDKESKERVKKWLKKHIIRTQASCLFVAHSDEDCDGWVDRQVEWPLQNSNGTLHF